MEVGREPISPPLVTSSLGMFFSNHSSCRFWNAISAFLCLRHFWNHPNILISDIFGGVFSKRKGF